MLMRRFGGRFWIGGQRLRGGVKEEEEEMEGEEEGEVEFVTDEEGLVSGDEEFDDWLGGGEMEGNEFEVESEIEEAEVYRKRKIVNGDNRRRKVTRIEVEYEEEREDQPLREQLLAK